MRVMIGETVEIDGKWQKIELTFEEIDLQRILSANNIRPDAKLTPLQAFRLQELEAQRLVAAHLNRYYPQHYPVPETRAQIQDFNLAQQKILALLSEQNG